jgi:transposase
MLAVRRRLNVEKVAAENAARLLEDAMLQRLSRCRIARLAADIDMLDRHLAVITASDPALAHRYRLLTSMPGVGPVLAFTLIALLPTRRSMLLTVTRLGALSPSTLS